MTPVERSNTNWVENNGQEKTNVICDEIDDFLKILLEEQKHENMILSQEKLGFVCNDGIMEMPMHPSVENGVCSGEASPVSSFGNILSPPCSPNSGENANSRYDKNHLSPNTHIHIPSTMCGDMNALDDGSYKYDPRPLGRKKRRNLVPDDKKTNDYWERRKRNNQAARRSREERRLKELQTFHSMKLLQNENASLKQKISMMMRNQQQLQTEVLMLKQLLTEATYK